MRTQYMTLIFVGSGSRGVNSSTTSVASAGASFGSMFPVTSQAQLKALGRASSHAPYTYNHTNYVYWPHTAQGRIGTTASGARAQRRRV